MANTSIAKAVWAGAATPRQEKEELHDASKRVRKASTSGDKGSCSGHVDEQNRLQQETSSATASQLHRQLAKPGQEAGTSGSSRSGCPPAGAGASYSASSQPGGPPTAGATGGNRSISWLDFTAGFRRERRTL
ncbi:unnamed protein product [Pleuronectes platessa]|uniref:Uncharacterized protein n=1 Tax=Pleuronectes platessa TaxID=8262 RepID=A0A9N7YKJ1_PLEPL|nr:unnamed protein product [Pleuronectes platessa]